MSRSFDAAITGRACNKSKLQRLVLLPARFDQDPSERFLRDIREYPRSTMGKSDKSLQRREIFKRGEESKKIISLFNAIRPIKLTRATTRLLLLPLQGARLDGEGVEKHAWKLIHPVEASSWRELVC